MSEIRTYHNIKMNGLHKPQLNSIIFNIKFAERIDPEKIKGLYMKRIFFKIPKWLAISKKLNSLYLYGRITTISNKAFEINYRMWFPFSQIVHCYIHLENFKSRQTNLKEYEKVGRI